jgi:5-methylcytosine-specific restriction endonuclease McrA
MERDAENVGRIIKLNTKHIRANQIQNKKRRLKENGGICDRCEIKVTPATSILHHEKPISVNFLMADDTDNHWVLCIPCNKKAHQLDGCAYHELGLKRVCKT